MDNLRQILYPAAKAKVENVQPIIKALSGGALDAMELHEPVYVAALLQRYWQDFYCQPEPGEDNGPPEHDETHQGAFADWVEIFAGRYWQNSLYQSARILGYVCSEVENTVPDEWLGREAGWVEVSRSQDWWLEANFGKKGTLYRVCMYAEGGFDLQFWFYCKRKVPDDILDPMLPDPRPGLARP